jgi:hypothetical protein
MGWVEVISVKAAPALEIGASRWGAQGDAGKRTVSGHGRFEEQDNELKIGKSSEPHLDPIRTAGA